MRVIVLQVVSGEKHDRGVDNRNRPASEAEGKEVLIESLQKHAVEFTRSIARRCP